MKKILFSFFTVIFSVFSLAQEYEPLLNSDNRWLVKNTITQEGENGGSYYLYKLSDLTTEFNGKIYTALQIKTCPISAGDGSAGEWSGWDTSEIYLHEDIEEEKVYVYYNDPGQHEFGEFILYDFNLEVGDSFPLNGYSNFYEGIGPLVISSVSNENLYGLNNLKTYQFEFPNYEMTVYEGIGSTTGLLTFDDFEDHYNLESFYRVNDYTPLIREGFGWEFSASEWDYENDIMYYTDYQARLSDEEMDHNEKVYKAIEWRTRERIEDTPQTVWGDWETKFYLSENIENREVHIYYPDNTVLFHPQGEYLLYDFNLNEGDNYNMVGFNEFDESNNAQIQSITFENVLGYENVRTYNLLGNNGEFPFQIYEGIGASTGLITHSFMYDAGWELTHYGILSNEEFDLDKTKIYPNPFTTQIQIETEKPIQNLQLFDKTGKLISSKSTVLELNSNLSELKSGVYILTITYKDHQKETVKLLKK